MYFTDRIKIKDLSHNGKFSDTAVISKNHNFSNLPDVDLNGILYVYSGSDLRNKFDPYDKN